MQYVLKPKESRKLNSIPQVKQWHVISKILDSTELSLLEGSEREPNVNFAQDKIHTAQQEARIVQLILG